MAVTAQAQSALTLEPSTTWALRPSPARRRHGRPWAAIGLVGAGMVAAGIATVTITVGSSAVGRDSVQANTSVDASLDGTLVGGYRSLVGRFQDADRAWRSQASRFVVGSATSAEALIRPSVQFADTIDRVDHDLVRLSWPASIRGDVKVFETDLATVSGDLRSIGGQRVSSMPQWVSNVVGDASQAGAASNRLTRQLGATPSGA